jgi:L1 cell adhesion molecule like protein
MIFSIKQVIWKYFYSNKSFREHGTLSQLKNLLERTNVKKDPSSNFNSCEDFFITIIKGLVVMDVCEMNSTDDCPSPHVIPEDTWLFPDSERKALLYSLVNKVLSKFVNFSYNNPKITSNDLVVEYSYKLLSTGLFYLEFRDGIREGDGECVIRCWKYLLPIFYNANRY